MPAEHKKNKTVAQRRAMTAKAREESIKAKNKASAKRRADKKAGKKSRRDKLLDGEITVKDLTLKELVRRTVSHDDGSFAGCKANLPPHVQERMQVEFVRRFRRDFDKLAPLALTAFKDILQDDSSPAQRFQAAKTVVEYQIGKVPDVIHHGAETEWDRMQQTAFEVVRGRSNVEVEVIDGEIINEQDILDD